MYYYNFLESNCKNEWIMNINFQKRFYTMSPFKKLGLNKPTTKESIERI